MKTRQKSATEERRNSVSDIKEYFQAQAKCSSPTMSNARKTTSTKSKDKEKERELREVRNNIKALIDNDGKLETSAKDPGSIGANANGGNVAFDHDKGNDPDNHDNSEIASGPNTPKLTSTATQTSEDEILKAIRELASKYQHVEEVLEDPKNGLSVQLAKTQEKVSGLYSDIHGAVSGLLVKMEKVTEKASDNANKIQQIQDSQSRMLALLDENKRVVKELKTMQGLVQKLSQKTTSNTLQVMDLTKRSMEQNIIIHGMDNSMELQDAREESPRFTKKERCKYAAIEFFKATMNVNLEVEDIYKAHRIGPIKQEKVRPMVLKLSYAAKDLIMENIGSLKGKSNPTTKQVYFISEQIPEGCTEVQKQCAGRAKVLRDENDKKPKQDRSSIQIVNNKILVDGQVHEPDVKPPQPSQLFVDAATQQNINLIQQTLIETPVEVVRNSEFLAIAAKVQSIQETNLAYIAVAQRYPAVDHIMMAYAFKEKDKVKTGFCDDEEYGAGTRIRRVLFEERAKDTAIFVLRKYGGIHLGFHRFSVIETLTKSALKLLKQEI